MKEKLKRTGLGALIVIFGSLLGYIGVSIVKTLITLNWHSVGEVVLGCGASVLMLVVIIADCYKMGDLVFTLMEEDDGK